MKENVVIIGGGIAGIEAAKQLLLLGYSPIIVEKQARLGGHVGEWHKLFPDMTPARELVEQMTSEISGANVFLETTVSSLNRLSNGYSVVLSNGIAIVCRAILIATGFHLFDAEKKEEYGYGVYNQVITNRDLEHWFNSGKDVRIDGREMKKIGFVHCVGSRDLKAGNSQCSKVCCVTAIKQAIEMKEKFPDAEIYCFYMDLRLFGKKYEDFYINAQKDYGIHFIRGRVSEVGEKIDGSLQVKAEDTLSGKPLKVTLDLLVLMAGMVCNPKTTEIARMIHADIDTDGFLRSRNNIYNIMESDRPGIFLAGTCTGTKTVPETVAEARAAVLSIHNYLGR
ncbi:MAG: FAD-dependent oxidoreductase [Bacteroidales bacterium]|nr:FAD-dependent oxidoreductase [Bacteroidales bacterium]